MLARVAAFEVRFLVRSPLFWIASAIFFLISFASVAVEGVSIGGRGLTHLNSPFALVQTVQVMAVFGVFVIVAFVAGAVVRDDETGFAPIVHTTRVTKPAYVVGRFLGATAVGYLVLCSVALGVLVGTWMPWLDPDKLGPFRGGDYLHVLLVLLLPTVLLLSAGFFALATGTRSMTTTYVGAVGFLALYFTAIIGLQDPRWLDLVALLDPFGLGAAEAMTRYWTTAERNTQLLPLAGPLLRNRLLWGAVTAVLFVLAYRMFRFEARPARGGKAERPTREPAPSPGPLIPSPSTPPPAAATLRVNGVEGRAQGAWSSLLTLARFDAVFVLRSPAFYVLLALGVLNGFASLFTSTDFRGAELLPVTRAMVRALDGAFALFPLLIAIYYAGELVWRDRERRVHEIVDATPAPDWTFLVPKLVAVTGVLAATVVVGVLTAVGTQLLKGWTTLELGHYLLWFALPTMVALFLFAVFAVFVQSVVPSKPLGWAAMLVYVVLMSSLSKAGFQHPLYRWSSTTPTPLSDMNGLGRFWVGAAWLNLYWLLLSIVVLVLAHALRRRGTEVRLAPRLRALPGRLRGTPGVLAALALAGAAVSGGWVFFNTNVLNTYRSDDDEEARQALVEKTLSPYEQVPQPTITDVKLDVQLFPREVRAVTRGEYAIENRTGAPLDHVHVRWDLRLRMDELQVDGGTVEQDRPDVHYRIFRLSPPMAPGERRRITFATTLEERGFPARDPLTRVVENGTFLDNSQVAPSLGWWRGEGLLTDRAKRRKYGLPELPRMAKLEDASARAHHYLRHDSDWVNAELSLTTDAGQVPVLPGYTVEDVTRGDRRTLRTRTEAPIHHFFSLLSARYAVKAQAVGGVETAVLHHPPHTYAVDRMLGAMKRSLEVFGRAFSPYQFRQLRVLEFPAYATFAQSFSNTIPYSEAIGFVADASDPEKVDIATYVTAHEVAHQWFGHQIVGADMQGGTMLVETFAQYGALLVMEDLYGKAQLRRFTKYELDRYLRSRGSELVEELPLARVENQGYIHYQKGTLVMAWLDEVVGREVVTRALRRLVSEFAFKPAPYPSSTDFLRILREEAGPAHDALITDLFEKITLYDLGAKGAKVTRRPDGKFEVALSVTAAKKYADGKGVETEAPMDELVEVGVFAAEPGKKGFREEDVLRLEKVRVKTGAATLTLVVDREPRWAGLDPFNRRIDRNSDDNLVKVE